MYMTNHYAPGAFHIWERNSVQIKDAKLRKKRSRRRTGMPSSDHPPEAPSRKWRFDRLNISRTCFDLSRKRVESLKLKKKIKRTKVYEKPAENAWVTSGNIGSRDAVLVFRTRILKTPNEDDITDGDDAAVSASNTSLDNCSTDSLFSISATTSASLVEMDSSLNENSNAKAKVLLSLPNNVKNVQNNINRSSPKVNSSILTVESELEKSPKKHSVHRHTTPDNISYESRSTDSASSEFDECLIDDEVKDIILKSRRERDPMVTSSSLFKNSTNQSRNNDTSNLQSNNSSDNKENVLKVDLIKPDVMPAEDLHITYKFNNTETRLLRKIFSTHGLVEATDDENFCILWTGAHMKPDILRNLTPYQRVNHFPRSYELTRKDRLYKNIEKMQYLRGFKHFDIVPQSFVLPMEYRDLVTAHNKCRGPWIVKPACSSRGRGIFIVNTPDQIPPDEQGLVSKYVADPLCIDGHKCDLRVYVLVTSFDPLLIYIYQEGLVRLATVKYDRNAENLWNPCMHLCNYSINKYHSDYIKSKEYQDEDVGHKWTLSALLRHLKNQGCNTKQLMVNIEDLIIKSIFATAQSIISACRMFVPNGNNCFELYGFDILVDDTLKPWLLEINLSPSMGVDSPVDTKVKAALMTDLLTLVGVPAYGPLMRAHYDSTWSRFRNVTYSRRTNSADTLGNQSHSYGFHHRSSKRTNVYQAKVLSSEEHRIIRNVRQQNARRGGFVRIFPTRKSMQKYGAFLDPSTGIPLTTTASQSHNSFSMMMPHNFNVMLYDHLYGKESKSNDQKEGNSTNERMMQYESVLESMPITFVRKKNERSVEEGTRLRKQVRKFIENGSEFTQLQARQAFSHFLESILKRLTQEPKEYHEKLILKFLVRATNGIKSPVFYKNPLTYRILGKDRSAMVAKLLSDYLEAYQKDTEAYIDSFDYFGKIPIATFNEFLVHAQEADLESVLTLHTNLTGNMPFLHNRCGPSVPPTPPIPTGPHGFLKALPSMVAGVGIGSKEMNRIDIYYKKPAPPPPSTAEKIDIGSLGVKKVTEKSSKKDKDTHKKQKPAATKR